MPAPYRAPSAEAPPSSRPSVRALGRQRSRHLSGTSARRVLAAATALAGLLAVLTLAWPHATWLVVAALALAVAVAGWVVVAGALGLDVTVDLHDAGIVVRRSCRRAAKMRFDDVDALYLERGRGPGAGVVLADGARRVRIPKDLTGHERVLAHVEVEVERPVLLRAERALASGETMRFGRLALELEGARDVARGTFLPWSEVGRIEVSRSTLVVRRRPTNERFLVLSTDEIPYARVLVALLARRTRVIVLDPFFARYFPRWSIGTYGRSVGPV